MKKLTLKKTTMVIVAASMAAQSMGLTALAKEAIQPLSETNNTSNTVQKSQEQVLTDAILEAQDAVKSKKALMDEALTALNEVKQNYESTKNEYEIAQTKVSTAEINANNSLLDEMKANLLDIKDKQAELEDLKSDAKKVDEESKEAEESYKKALAERDAAQKAYDEAVANASEVSEEGIAQAKKAVEDAESAVAQAKLDYDNAVSHKAELEQVVTDNEAALKEAQFELNKIENDKSTAETKLVELNITLSQLKESVANDTTDEQITEKQKLISQYQTEYDNLMIEVNDYTKSIESLNQECTNIEAKKTSAEQELSDMDTNIASAKALWDTKVSEKDLADEALKKAEQNITDNAEKSAQLQKEVDNAKAKLDAAQKAYDEAMEKLDVQKAAVVAAEEKVNSMTEEYNNALKKWNQGAYGYYKSLDYSNDDVSDKAVYEYESEVIDNETNRFNVKFGEETDPSSINNMIVAIDYIKKCNELRKENGLNELKIDMGLMAYAQLNSANNISQVENNTTYGHTGVFNCAENIAYGPDEWNPFDGWYDEEYQGYQDAIASGKYEDLENMTSYQIYKQYPALWHELGHYLNIVDERYQYTGFGLGELSTDDFKDGYYHHSQTFSQKGTGDIIMTVEEYEKSLTAYVDSLKKVLDEYKDAVNKLSEAKKTYDESQKQTSAYDELQKAQTAYDTSKNNLSASVEETSKLQTVRDEKETLYNQALTAVSEAQNNYDSKVSEKSELESKIQSLQDQISDLKDEISKNNNLKQESLNNAQKKQSLINGLNGEITELQTKKSNLLDSLSDAEKAVTEQSSKVSDLEKEVSENKSNVSDKEKVLNESIRVSDSYANVVKDKQTAKNLAESNLQDAKDSYSNMMKLNASVNSTYQNLETAKANVTSANNAQKEASAKVAEFASKIGIATNELSALNTAKTDFDSLKSCFDKLKSGNLNVEIPTLMNTTTESIHNQIVNLLTQYKSALIELNSKTNAYNEVKSVYDLKSTTYQNTKKDYEEALDKQKEAEKALSDYLDALSQIENGSWKKDNTGWWFQYKNGSYPKNEEIEINGHIYSFNSQGYMRTGWVLSAEGWKYFCNSDTGNLPKGALCKSMWINNYYVNENGIMETNKWIGNYYVDSNGLWTPDKWVQTNGKWWYRHQDGSYTKNDFEIIAGSTYYFDGNGYMVTDWKNISGSDYYFKSSGEMAKNSWIGNYYVGSDGKWIPNKWVKEGSKYWYRYGDGTYPKSGIYQIGGQSYCFDSSGYMLIGWQNVNGNDYYFKSSGEMAKNSWIGNYYVGSDGKWIPNKWVKEGSKYWYRYGDGTYPKSGIYQIGGQSYYFDSNGYMQTGWKYLNGSWYYFDQNGYMKTGELYLNSNYYYFNGNGIMQTGLADDGWEYNAAGERMVYWSKFSTEPVYHKTPHQIKSKNLVYGTYAQAVKNGKTNLCKTCHR